MRIQSSVLVGLVSLGLWVPGAWAQSRNQLQGLFGRVSGSFLGVGLQEISSDRAKQLRLPEEAGVEITSVENDSPASAAGVKVGDVILQYNGQRVEGVEQFQRMVQETPVGREVKLQLFRNGNRETVTAKIGSRPNLLQPRTSLVYPTEPPQNVAPRVLQTPATAVLGIQGEAIDGQLADYFGVKSGVLVRSVARDSAADKAGVKAGDVITRVDNAAVSSPAEVAVRVRRNQSATITLTRDKREMTVSVNPAGPGPLERF
jgi:serine protease Do